MPVLYGPFQSVLKDKNGEQLFYPRVLRTGNVSTSQISKEIAAYSSLSPGDVKNTLDNLVTAVRFLPCSTRHLDGTMATRSLVTGARCVRFDRADTSASGEGEGGKPEGGGSGGVTPDPSV